MSNHRAGRWLIFTETATDSRVIFLQMSVWTSPRLVCNHSWCLWTLSESWQCFQTKFRWEAVFFFWFTWTSKHGDLNVQLVRWSPWLHLQPCSLKQKELLLSSGPKPNQDLDFISSEVGTQNPDSPAVTVCRLSCFSSCPSGGEPPHLTSLPWFSCMFCLFLST